MRCVWITYTLFETVVVGLQLANEPADSAPALHTHVQRHYFKYIIAILKIISQFVNHAKLEALKIDLTYIVPVSLAPKPSPTPRL